MSISIGATRYETLTAMQLKFISSFILEEHNVTESSYPHLLVTGAGGHLGRRVIELLLEAGVPAVTAASRQPGKISDLAARGARLRSADFDDPASLDEAFASVDRLLLISTDALGTPGQRQRQHKAAVDAAVKAGVKHIVYTSMVSPESDSPIPFAPDHLATEQAIENSGIPYTILRVNWYAEYFFVNLPSALRFGKWLTSAGEGHTAYVARDDVARAAAAALRSATDRCRRFDITGPQALTPAQVVTSVNTIFNSNIKLVSVSDEVLAATLADSGTPGPLVELVVAMEQNSREGRVAVVSDAVEQLTGKPPISLFEFLLDHRLDLLLASKHSQ